MQVTDEVKDGANTTSTRIANGKYDIADSELSGANGKREKKSQFSGSCSFVVSLLRCSMGMSDFWRFPYLVFKNGGGAFLIPFTLAMLVFGIPLYILEVFMGQFSGKGPVNVWQSSPFFKGIGMVLLLLSMLISCYSNILRTWLFQYVVGSFSSELPWKHCDNEWNRAGCIGFGNALNNKTSNGSLETGNMTSSEQYWMYNVLQLSSGIENLDGVIWKYVLYIFVLRVCVGLCIVKSIKSIEKVLYVTVFVPIILCLIVWIRSLTLEGSGMGMLYYITPKLDKLSEPKVWLEASVMAFYTLGPGWGSLLLFGSYNKFSSNCYRHAIVATVCDWFAAVLNGLVCFSILGVMAHGTGLDLEQTVTSGLSLGFTVYPVAFIYFPMSQVWSAIYFITLIMVGIDGIVTVIETVMNCLNDLYPTLFLGRRKLLMNVLINMAAVLLSLPFCTRVIQLLNWRVLYFRIGRVGWTVMFVAFVESVVFMWIYGGDRISQDMQIMLGRPLPALVRICGAVFTPIGILILILMSFVQYRTPTLGTYEYPMYAEILGWGMAVVLISPIFITFVWNWLKTDGFVKEKIQAMARPSHRWAPNDEKCAATYRDHDVFKRNLKDVFIFNIMGRINQQTMDSDQNLNLPMLGNNKKSEGSMV